MQLNDYVKSKAKGLAHVSAWANDPIDRALHLLAANEGSRDGCLRSVGRRAKSTALMAHFDRHNLDDFKQWSSASAKLLALVQHENPSEGYLTEELLWPLVSDNEEVIDWYRQHRAMYDLDKKVSGGDKDDPKNWMFYRYQSWLALNSRWDELGERCERILAMQDQIKKDRSYLIDHRFYLALSRGDKAAMEAVLSEKCTPANRKLRYEQESGLTRDFIDSYAVVFAKLAWRNGYQVQVDTPWIPSEWLPMRPLPAYEDPWPFLQKFDLFQPFEGDWASWSPKRL